MGIVEAVGSAVTNLAVGDRVVVPFNISCGHCFMCDAGPAVAVRDDAGPRRRARAPALFGYTKLYGQVPGGQAELLRVPHADYGPIKVPRARRTTASCSSPTCSPRRGRPSQYAASPKDGSVAVLGLGPIGDMATRIAQHLGVEQVIGVDLVPERLERARVATASTSST